MSQVQQVKAATDLIQIISERLSLKRSGSNFRALCPFHTEKTPSFFVSEILQRYRCFGCGKQGDALEFLQEYERMSFTEALRFLADRAGIKLTEFQPTYQDDERDQVLAVLNLAKEYYHYLLTDHRAGGNARQYLIERRVNQDSLKLFQLGYASATWDGLIKYLHQKKHYPVEA